MMLLGATSVFAACGVTPTPGIPATSQPQSTLPPPLATPMSALPDDVLVVYHKTGGIAGVDETLTVHRGGLLELRSRDGKTKTLKVEEPMLIPLRGTLEQDDFGKLQAMYPASGADLFTYTITARAANGQVKSVTALDGAEFPDQLGLLIGMLDQLLGQVRQAP